MNHPVQHPVQEGAVEDPVAHEERLLEEAPQGRLQLALYPEPNRKAETLLGPVRDITGQVARGNPPQDMLQAPQPHLVAGGQSSGELDHLVIQKGRAHLHRPGHRHVVGHGGVEPGDRRHLVGIEHPVDQILDVRRIELREDRVGRISPFDAGPCLGCEECLLGLAVEPEKENALGIAPSAALLRHGDEPSHALGQALVFEALRQAGHQALDHRPSQTLRQAAIEIDQPLTFVPIEAAEDLVPAVAPQDHLDLFARHAGGEVDAHPEGIGGTVHVLDQFRNQGQHVGPEDLLVQMHPVVLGDHPGRRQLVERGVLATDTEGRERFPR